MGAPFETHEVLNQSPPFEDLGEPHGATYGTAALEAADVNTLLERALPAK